MSRSAQWFTINRWLSKIHVLQSCASVKTGHHHANMNMEDSGKSAPKNTIRRSPPIRIVSFLGFIVPCGETDCQTLDPKLNRGRVMKTRGKRTAQPLQSKTHQQWWGKPQRVGCGPICTPSVRPCVYNHVTTASTHCEAAEVSWRAVRLKKCTSRAVRLFTVRGQLFCTAFGTKLYGHVRSRWCTFRNKRFHLIVVPDAVRELATNP
jgi:hypothetical protein